jgi:hypothetical protein
LNAEVVLFAVLNPSMRSYRLFAVFVFLHTLATMVGWLAALGQIRAIVFLGPVLSLTGLAISVMALFRGHRLGVWFGLGVPALSLFCLVTIAGNRWSPAQAYYPINSVIAVFVLAHAPLCGLVIRDAQRRLLKPGEKFHYQFSIAGIMTFTAFVAATLGLQRALGFSGLTLAVLLWHVVVIAWYWWTEPAREAGKDRERDLAALGKGHHAER